MWFSPEGDKLAYATFNDHDVDVMSIPYYGNPANLDTQYPKIFNVRYPKVINSRCWIYEISNGAKAKAIKKVVASLLYVTFEVVK